MREGGQQSTKVVKDCQDQKIICSWGIRDEGRFRDVKDGFLGEETNYAEKAGVWLRTRFAK